jgi:hypothetical protein
MVLRFGFEVEFVLNGTGCNPQPVPYLENA